MYRFPLFFLLLVACPTLAQTNRQGPLSANNYIKLDLENDLFQLRQDDVRDQNFTNAIRLEWMNRRQSPLNFMLLEFPNDPANPRLLDKLYTYSLGQEMYTPLDLSVKSILYQQRPYAGWLYVSSGLVTVDVEGAQKLTSSVGIGVMGPASLSEPTQKLVHRIGNYTKPEGWHNQIVNSVGVSYLVRYEARPFRHPFHRAFDLIGLLEGHVGSVTNYFGAGGMLRIGQFNDYFQNVTGLYEKGAYVNEQTNKVLYSNVEKARNDKIRQLDSLGQPERKQQVQRKQSQLPVERFSNQPFQLYAFMRPVGRVVLDNSFLQGGWGTDGKNPYVIASADITRFYINVEYGGVISYKRMQICYTQSFRTAEFTGASTQQWGRLALTVGF